MADAEVEIKAHADVSQAQAELERTAAALDRVAGAVTQSAESLRQFDLSPLSAAMDEFERTAQQTDKLSGAVDGWRDEVDGARASAEQTVDALGELALRFEDLAEGVRNGSVSTADAVAQAKRLKTEYDALSVESKSCKQAIRSLYNDLKTAGQVAAETAATETANAEKALSKVESASEKKRRARELEGQSVDQLRQKLETLRATQEQAASVGNKGRQAAAAQEAAAVEAALQKRMAAESRAAAQEEKLSADRQVRMGLEGLSYIELSERLKQLTAARVAAARAGDTAAYDRLTKEVRRTKAAVEDLTTRAHIARNALLGKAQAGIMAAEQMRMMASGLQDGTASMGDLATAAISVGLAIKAGLGPIGWAMAAVQGLSMAYDWLANRKKRAAEAAQEAKNAIVELNETLRQNAEALAKAQDEANNNVFETEKKRLEELEADHQHMHDAQIARVESRKQAELQALREQIEAEKEHLKAQLDAGEISLNHYTAEIDAKRKALQELERESEATLAQMRLAQAEQAVRDAENRERLASEHLQRLRRDLDGGAGYDWAKQWTDAELERYSQLKKQYGNLVNVVANAKAYIKNYEAQIKTGEQEARFEQWIADAKHQQEVAEGQLELINRDFESLLDWRRVGLMQVDAAFKLEGKALADFAFASAQKAAEAQRAAAAERRNRELRQEEAKAARAQLERAQNAPDTYAAEQEMQRYKEKIRDREERWARVQALSYDEQERWLRLEIDHMAEGSQIRDEYNRRLQNVLLQQVTAGELSTSYSARDMRTQADRLTADRAILQTRLRELSNLSISAREAGAAPETIKQINEKLTETSKTLTGLEQSAREAAIEVLRRLNVDNEGFSVDLVANLRRYQPALNKAAQRLEKMLEHRANLINRQSETLIRGDDDNAREQQQSINAITRRIRRLAQQADQYTASGDMATVAVQQAFSDQRIMRDAARRRTRAEQRTAAAREREAQRAEQDNTRATRQATAQQTGEAQAARVQQAGEGLRQQNAQMRQFVSRCESALGSLVQTCQTFTAFMADANARIAQQQTQIDSLQRQVRTQARNSI